MMKRLKLLVLAFMVVGLTFAVGCNDSGSDADTGSVSLSLADATTDDYQAVYVTVDEVLVHLGEAEGGEDDAGQNSGGNAADSGNQIEDGTRDDWKVVAEPHTTYNLLELVNGVMAELGTTELATGRYTQMRLMLGDAHDGAVNLMGDPHPYAHYVVDSQGAAHELTVPSGYQTGVKLVHAFEIVAGKTVELVLDFDAAKSVVVSGDESFKLKPTIKVIDTIDNAVVQGVVTDAAGNPLAGATVSAQLYYEEAAFEMDRVEVFTSTVTAADDPATEADETGAYQMYLPPGNYQIVAFKDADTTLYGPACDTIDAVYNVGYDIDLVLDEEAAGGITAQVTTADAEDVISISVRETTPCALDGQIEVASLTVSGSGAFTIDLPGAVEGARSYTVVAESDTAEGAATVEQIEQVEVSAGLDTDVTFDFTAPQNP